MTSINLIDYNNSDTVRKCELVYNTDGISSDKLYCTKFRLQTQTFPVYIPKILKDEEVDILDINGARNVLQTLQPTDYTKNPYIALNT